MSHDPPNTTYKIRKGEIDTEYIRSKLKLKSLEARKALFEKYPHVEKFFQEKGFDISQIREHSANAIASGALTGALLFAPPILSDSLPTIANNMVKSVSSVEAKTINSQQENLLSSLRRILPQKIGPLDRTQEKTLEQIFNENLKINAKANLEGEHLNTTYGYIGAEQHLMRYPGDVVSDMAPGKGAWGYFAGSKSDLTAEDIEREKWYVVVQTLYLPDWEKRLSYLRDWYKYRKVLVVNTLNGNAVVGDIADSGPAAWTGKQFGGSPEVMNYLGGSRYKKGPVVIFFIDDPENKVKLGPVEYNKVEALGLKLIEA